ncbi:hypothetical protein ACFV19_07035 [Streptomyces griseoluteus]|uniref:hypothetical protein n=1 Tax=Streptomyces griseoluteus TaxID=29306 RepID=UPI0036750D2B
MLTALSALAVTTVTAVGGITTTVQQTARVAAQDFAFRYLAGWARSLVGYRPN